MDFTLPEALCHLLFVPPGEAEIPVARKKNMSFYDRTGQWFWHLKEPSKSSSNPLISVQTAFKLNIFYTKQDVRYRKGKTFYIIPKGTLPFYKEGKCPEEFIPIELFEKEGVVFHNLTWKAYLVTKDGNVQKLYAKQEVERELRKKPWIKSHSVPYTYLTKEEVQLNNLPLPLDPDAYRYPKHFAPLYDCSDHPWFQHRFVTKRPKRCFSTSECEKLGVSVKEEEIPLACVLYNWNGMKCIVPFYRRPEFDQLNFYESTTELPKGYLLEEHAKMFEDINSLGLPAVIHTKNMMRLAYDCSSFATFIYEFSPGLFSKEEVENLALLPNPTPDMYWIKNMGEDQEIYPLYDLREEQWFKENYGI